LRGYTIETKRQDRRSENEAHHPAVVIGGAGSDFAVAANRPQLAYEPNRVVVSGDSVWIMRVVELDAGVDARC
jgi:hypothetical protein